MVDDAVHRPAVRIICLDAAGNVLLLHWRDPSDGALLWEPPGGGIEAGETPLAAACRELVEETGLDPAAIGARCTLVDRDTRWNGRRFVGPEPFFVARFAGIAPELGRDGLLPDEQQNLQGYAWVPWQDLTAPPAVRDRPGRLEPPGLLAVLASLEPTGPWAA
jgi:8-oxo-dGTP pyrophosphatase MutT (NUDIX family)